MTNADSATRFLAISPYVSVPDNLQPPLSGEIRADVAIVGGGYTGLSTALELKKAGIDAVIIEKNFCGFGASGRNAGHLTPTVCKDLPTAVMLFGKQGASDLARFSDHCVENAELMIRSYAIDCDYNASGNIMAVVHPGQEKRLRQAAEVAKSLGARMHFVEAGEMRERGIPKTFLCGAMEEAGGTLHTGKLVLGLRQAALDAGIRIYEQTEVLRITDEATPRVMTSYGCVSADRVVLASNAYTPEIGKPGNRILPLYITLMESEPLNDEQLAAIGGWAGREGIYTAHESMESYRLTAQRTIIWGSKDVHYFYGGKTTGHGGEQDASRQANGKAFRARFPELASLKIAHSWGGWIGMTLNFLPIVGQATGQATLYHSVGYNGHGVAQSTYMGTLLTDQILGRSNEWFDIICRKPVYLPPEPLRWLAARSMLGVVNGIDRYFDKRIPSGR